MGVEALLSMIEEEEMMRAFKTGSTAFLIRAPLFDAFSIDFESDLLSIEVGWSVSRSKFTLNFLTNCLVFF